MGESLKCILCLVVLERCSEAADNYGSQFLGFHVYCGAFIFNQLCLGVFPLSLLLGCRTYRGSEQLPNFAWLSCVSSLLFRLLISKYLPLDGWSSGSEKSGSQEQDH